MKYFVYPFLYLLAILPFPLLYILSEALYGFVFYLTGYRKKVVLNNLRNAFPEYNDRKIQRTARQFYRHLSDLVLETIKTLAISREKLIQRCSIVENESFRALKQARQGAIILTAHYGNWEWAGQSLGLQLDQPVNVVYKPLRSGTLNHVLRLIRTYKGNEVSSMRNVMRNLVRGKERGLVSCFLADQTPLPENTGYRGNFLNQDTPFFTGPGRIAQKLGLPVFFGEIHKLQRGYYRIEIQQITPDASDTEPPEITAEYARLLEKGIKKQPHTWLWSHRRWKRKRPH